MSTGPFFNTGRSPEPTPPPARRAHHPRAWFFIWTGVILGALIVIVVAGVAVLLHCQRFHQYLLAKADFMATKSLGTRVDVQNFALRFSPLGLDVYGIVVDGATPYPHPPLLQSPHVYVGVGITSVVRRQWYLTKLRIDHPVVHIFVDQHGTSNLPKPKGGKSGTTIWDLGIRRTILDQGEIYYNDRATLLSADLHDLGLRSSFSELQQMYSCRLQYTNGRVVLGSYRPFLHNFDAVFDLTPSTFRLHRAHLAGGATQVNLTATATHFSAPDVQGNYDITIDGTQMAQLMRNESVPAGLVHLTGSASYHQVPNTPVLQTVSVSGDLTSKRLVIGTASRRAAVESLIAHYSLDHGDAVLHDLRAGILGGEITAQGRMQKIGETSSHSEMTSSLRNVSVAETERLAASRASRSVALRGELNAGARATWGRTMDDLTVKVDSSVHGGAERAHSAAGTNASAGGVVPLDSEVHALYAARNETLTLTNSYVRMPETDLTLNGMIGKRSSLTVALEAKDLRELASLAEILSTPPPGQHPAPMKVAGSATFRGNVSGSTSAPHLTGQLVVNNLQFNGTTWRTLRTGVELSPSQAQLIHADLEPAPKGHIIMNARAGLHKWTFTKSSPLEASLNASQVDLQNFAKLADKDIPITGTLNADVHLHGSEENPMGNGKIALLQASAYGEPIDSARIDFNGTGEEADAKLSIRLPAGSIQSAVTVWPKEKKYIAQLTSTGLAIDKIETIKKKDIGAAGIMAFQASGQGTFDNPQLTASVQMPSLTIRNQKVADLRLDASVGNHVANATLTSAIFDSTIQAKARVELTGGYQTDATIDTRNLSLQPIVAIVSPENASSLSGSTELHATLHGPIKNKSALEAQVTIPHLNLAWNNTIQLAAVAPIRADYRNRVLTLEHSAIRGTDTNLEFEGSIPVGSKGPSFLLLEGDVNLQLAQLFSPDIRSSGNLRFNIDSRGTTAEAIAGEIDLVNANYASDSLPVGLQNGNGVLKLTGDHLNIQSFQGTVGGGQVTATGGVQYRPAVRFDVRVAANKVGMLYPPGTLERLDANIRLIGSTDDAVLGGNVDLTNIAFTPAFDLSSFIGQFSSGGVAPPPSPGGISQNIRLNVAIHSSNSVNLVSRTLSVNGSANLQLRGTVDNPVILGRINLTGGDIILNGDRFLLTGATIQFINPSETQPVLNATVTTTIQQYDISMRFRGPVDQMQTQYTSNPALPEEDIIHLLAFGSTTEAASSSAATPANQMAEGLVANQVSSQITSRVARVAGISQLSISPVLGNAQNNQQAGANITVQQRVSGNLFVTFTDNTAQGTETIQGQYRLSPRVSVSATRDPNGGVGADLLIKKEY